MRITQSRPVTEVSRTSPVSGRQQESAPAYETRSIQDTTSVMGIPEAELTPKVRAAIMTLMEEVETLRRQFSRAQERLGELERLANLDPLTPVPNRRAFVHELTRVISHAERYGSQWSLAFLDANGLKEINDSYGHAAGDAALVQVAETLVENTRSSDYVGRLGGDEFGVILAEADEATALLKSEQLAEAIRAKPLNWEGQQIPLSVARGVYPLKPGEHPVEALANADKAMYQHKTSLKSND